MRLVEDLFLIRLDSMGIKIHYIATMLVPHN